MTQGVGHPQVTILTGQILRAHGFGKKMSKSFDLTYGLEGKAIDRELIDQMLNFPSLVDKVDELAWMLLDPYTYYTKFEARNEALEREYQDQLKAISDSPLGTFIWQQAVLAILAIFPALGGVGLAGMIWPTISVYGFLAVCVAVLVWIVFVSRLGSRWFPDPSLSERVRLRETFRKAQRELLLSIWDEEHPVSV